MKTKQLLDVRKLRQDFPILFRRSNGKSLVYLDNSATSLTPELVLDAMNRYYREYNANVHRAIHSIGQKATEEYESAHQKVADFINAEFKEIIFTKNTTESLNLLAYSLTKKLQKGDEILLTEMEHHSNLVPWQQLSKDKGLILKFIRVDDDGNLDMKNARELITNKTKIISVVHMSNVLGTINDVKEIGKIAHAKNAIFIVDGAQSVPHIKVDVKGIDCDFFVFSAHKMCGPTGIGVLYGKKEFLEKMDPFLYGGDMISQVTFEDSKWNDIPWKFEAGTPNIAESIGLAKAIDYLNIVGMDKIKDYEEYLTEYALEKLSKIKKITIYGQNDIKKRGSVISFNIDGIHPHDVAAILDRDAIAIRGGHLCAMPFVTSNLNVDSVCRLSLYFYNTTEDIDKLIEGIKKAKEVFKI